MRHEWFANGVMLGYRYDNSPIVLAGRHAGAARSRRIPTPRPPGPAPARRMSGSTTAARRSTCSAAASCCCGSAAIRRPARGIEQRGSRARRAADLASRIDEPDVLAAYERRLVLVRPDGHVAWRADTEPADAGALIDVVRGQSTEVKQQKLGRTS